MDFITIIGAIVTVVGMIACPIIANKKGRSAVGWFFGGFLLGGIGLIIIACPGDKNLPLLPPQEGEGVN